MFGIDKIKLDLIRLWNAIERVDKTATCALKDGDVRHEVVHRLNKQVQEQGQAIHALSEYLGVTFTHKSVPDPSMLPPAPIMMEVMVCVPRPSTTGEEKGEK